MLVVGCWEVVVVVVGLDCKLRVSRCELLLLSVPCWLVVLVLVVVDLVLVFCGII